MAELNGDLLQAIIVLIWTCLCAAPWKAPLFRTLLFSQEIIAELCSAASLSFCPGLLEVLNASKPPDIEWFFRLPSAKSKGKCWGIYVLVLWKDGCHLPRIYIGSATQEFEGLMLRMRCYDKPDKHRSSLPVHIDAALVDGWIIVHQGVLAWCPVPSAARLPMIRLLLVALEAAFSFIFWAMRSKTANYGMGSFGNWSTDAFQYDGLCSHSSLLERVFRNFDLTEEQREKVAAEAKARRDVYYLAYRQTDSAKAAHSEAAKKYVDANPDKRRQSLAKHSAKAKASLKHICRPCNYITTDSWKLETHNKGTAHQDKVKLRASIQKTNRKPVFFCVICCQKCRDKHHFKSHNESKTHLERVDQARLIAEADANGEVQDK